MDFAQLRARITEKKKIDLDPIFAHYSARVPEPNVDGFLQYLFEQRVIDASLFTELHAMDAVDTSIGEPSLAFNATVQSPPTHASSGAQTNGDAMATNIGKPPIADVTSSRPPPPDGANETYEVLGELGKGAMGEVHIARDVVLRRKVALKSILPAMQQNQSLFSRFLGEMQITAQLDHPFIVPVYGIENGPGGGLAYAMKLVQGREFGVLLEETKQLLEAGKPLDAIHSIEGRLEAFLKVCDALSYAHERGVVHRDLKPANIMIGRFNEVYVMDWGIARVMGQVDHAAAGQTVEVYDASGTDVRQTARTRVGSTIGTPIYMSPEQAAGLNDQLDGRSDLYSLGLILQEVVTLGGAMGGTTLEEVLTNAKGGKRLPPTPAAPGIEIPRELRAIIDKATRLKPEDRYPNVAAFADDIRRYLRNEAVQALPDTGMQSAGRWVSKHRMATIAALLLVLVLGAGATIAVLLYNDRVVKQQHTRELRLAELQASSAMGAEELDATLQHYEGQLAKLAGATGMALQGPATTGGELHFADEFKQGPKALPGLVDAPFYGGLESFDFPVASLAPGASKEEIEAHLGGITALKSLAKSVMLDSVDPEYHLMSEEDRQEALAVAGAPITRISLTLENGLHIEYPGNSALAPDYDGRKEQAYKDMREEYGVEWGNPVPRKDGGVTLPCRVALRDSESKLLGVLMFDVDPNRAVSAALETSDEDYVESSLLVDPAGKLLAQRNQGGASAEAETLAMPDVREAMARGERGYLQTQRGGHDVLVTYQPLSTVGWYFVTVASTDAIKRAEQPTNTHAGSVTAKPVATTKPPATPKPPAPRPPVATATATATAAPSAEPSASAVASASPPPSAAPPALTGRLSDLQQPSAAPSAPPPPPPPPPNPFEPWKAYDKNIKRNE